MRIDDEIEGIKREIKEIKERFDNIDEIIDGFAPDLQGFKDRLIDVENAVTDDRFYEELRKLNKKIKQLKKRM